jgi:hypothetical protein
VRKNAWPRCLRPSLGDLLAISLVVWLFSSGQGWMALLADGDSGWHIRTGEWILKTRSVPTHDLFSFSRSGAPWFAWEWLSDVVFAFLHRYGGLAGLAALAGCVITLAFLVVFRHMLWRGANALVALGAVLVCAGASSIHFLARPHVFTLLLLAVSLWIVEGDRRQRRAAVWLLVPLSAVWVNLHSGFFALPACLAVLAAGMAVEAWLNRAHCREKWLACRRYAGLAAACSAASLVNPYGIGLHRHVSSYLSSDWIRNVVDEFQAPRFRSENLLHFEVLLLVALLVAGYLITQLRIADALLVVFWAHLALGSVRHVPVFAVVSAPLVATELSRLWERRAQWWSPQSVGRILWALGDDLIGSFRRLSVWSVVLTGAVLILTPANRRPSDFPGSMFPISLIRAEHDRLVRARVFTSDQWGDYLIYSGWPQQRVFIDGRSDFYGPLIGGEYLQLMHGQSGWEGIFNKYAFDMALIPRRWPLVTLLDRDPAWRRIREDRLGVLYERRASFITGLPNHTAAGNRY